MNSFNDRYKTKTKKGIWKKNILSKVHPDICQIFRKKLYPNFNQKVTSCNNLNKSLYNIFSEWCWGSLVKQKDKWDWRHLFWVKDFKDSNYYGKIEVMSSPVFLVIQSLIGGLTRGVSGVSNVLIWIHSVLKHNICDPS